MNDDDSPFKERRAHPRTSVTLKVEYPSLEGFLQDYTINLSQGGTMIRTNRTLQIGELIHLSLSFPRLWERIHLKAEVRWIRTETNQEKTIGVAFNVKDEQQKNALADLVERLQKEDPLTLAPAVKILIVEDNPHMARLIKEGLNSFQSRWPDAPLYDSKHVVNGQEALAHLDQNTYDLLIVDFYMPIMTGETLVKTLRQNPRYQNLPIIMVSSDRETTKERSLAAGADFFLDKPFRLLDVLETMRKLIQSHKLKNMRITPHEDKP
jgi:uncharacterized protein (TIGR02266 family)